VDNGKSSKREGQNINICCKTSFAVCAPYLRAVFSVKDRNVFEMTE